MRTRQFAIICILFLGGIVNAQNSINYKLEKQTLTIKGTSSLHDWEMIASDISCNTSLTLQAEKVISFNTVNFVCASKSLKSDHSLMDSKALEAIQSKKHSKITFTLEASDITNSTAETFSAKLKGVLTLAGISKEILLPISGEMKGSAHFHVQGEVALKMTDFNIIPPTAMFGTITTGDDISLIYDFIFTQDNLQALTENE